MKPNREIFWGFLLFLMTAIVIRFFINPDQVPAQNISESLDLSSKSKNQELVADEQIKSQNKKVNQSKNVYASLEPSSEVAFRKLPQALKGSPHLAQVPPRFSQLQFSEISSEWLGAPDLKTSLVQPAQLSELYGEVHQLHIVQKNSQEVAWPLVVYSERQKDYGLITGTLILQISPENLDDYIERFGFPFYESQETGFYYFKASSFEELKKWSEEARNLNPKNLQVEVLRGEYARQ